MGSCLPGETAVSTDGRLGLAKFYLTCGEQVAVARAKMRQNRTDTARECGLRRMYFWRSKADDGIWIEFCNC